MDDAFEACMLFSRLSLLQRLARWAQVPEYESKSKHELVISILTKTDTPCDPPNTSSCHDERAVTL